MSMDGVADAGPAPGSPDPAPDVHADVAADEGADATTSVGAGNLLFPTYDPTAAATFADANWDDGVGLCAEFVSDSLIAGNAPIDVVTFVPTLLAAFDGIPFDEIDSAGTPVSASVGDVVIYSDDSGSNFCIDGDPDLENCGHTGIIVVGGLSADTILADFHNNAHYHLPISGILGSGYTTFRVYHLTEPGCTADAQCNGGRAGTGIVCSDENACIMGCHEDSDCPGGVCAHTSPHWSCQ
jgi:hypothetical protein